MYTFQSNLCFREIKIWILCQDVVFICLDRVLVTISSDLWIVSQMAALSTSFKPVWLNKHCFATKDSLFTPPNEKFCFFFVFFCFCFVWIRSQATLACCLFMRRHCSKKQGDCSCDNFRRGPEIFVSATSPPENCRFSVKKTRCGQKVLLNFLLFVKFAVYLCL